jgi:hypothetical protein
MEEIILQQQNTIVTLFNEKLLPVFLRKITVHDEAMLKIGLLQKKLINKNFSEADKNLVVKELHNYKKELETIVSNYFTSKELEDEILFEAYYTSLNTYLELLDASITRTQDKERFFSLDTDSKLQKFRKTIKRALFNLSKIPLKTTNIFRKTKKEFGFWQQEIPFKNITEYYFKSELTNNTGVVFDAVYCEISEITNKYWSIDKEIDAQIEQFLANDNNVLTFSDILLSNLDDIPSLETRIENHKLTLTEIYEATVLKYKNALYKADTIELSANSFNLKKNTNYQKSVVEKNQRNELLWQNTYNVLKSDWELDIEIFTIIFKVISKYNELGNSIDKKSNVIYKELEVIKKYINDVKVTIADAKTDTAIKKSIVNELKNFNTTFKKIIKKTTILVSNQELPLQINQFEESTLGILKTLSTKRAINTDNDYCTKTSTSSINFISPYELVTYQSWPILDEKINKAKIELNLKVTNFIDDINALSQVCEFNLESALSLFENLSQENTPKKVALEGLDRSEEKIEDLKNTLANLNNANGELLLPSIDKFNESILALTNTENILEIRLTIARARSIEKSKLLKKKVINNVKNFIPIALLFIKTKYLAAVAYVKNVLLRNGLYKEPLNESRDSSNFLKEAENALNALPYVYQRLFRSETLQNEALFIGRKEVIKTLEKAYRSFHKNHHSATVVIGERGSGKTSLIHYFLNKNNDVPKAIFLSSNENISEPIEFIAFLNSAFKKELSSIDEWIQYFNSGKKRTIVLENLQYLYFRKVGGFNVLHQLSHLISATKNNVFWVVTSAKYAFQYLDKSIQIAELFAFNIEMNQIDKETITEALIKRHKISGYNLQFIKPPVAYLTKKFLKSPVEVQQETLREEFFIDINKIAQSNFKIAFMYWIRSTVRVSGSTIYMRSLKSIDTSFLNKIAPAKLLLMNSILLQERLKMDDIVVLSSLDEQHTQNIVNNLFETGLLTMDNGEFYTINIFLYRQITTLLKSKNVIH